MKFIAVDGEGVTDENGIHRYVMISIGDITLMSNDGLRHECFGCITPIEVGNIIAVPVESGENAVTNYYHPACYYLYGAMDRTTSRIAVD
jgi:hypothetical protein